MYGSYNTPIDIAGPLGSVAASLFQVKKAMPGTKQWFSCVRIIQTITSLILVSVLTGRITLSG